MPIKQPLFSVDELKRYSRQIYLPQIGHTGQRKLYTSHALILGLGGLGSPASLYLAASGIGKLSVVDFDQVELSNLQRQIIHQTADIGKNKACSAAETINQLNPHVAVDVIAQELTHKQLQQRIQEVDIVLDCSDNFDTRYTINRCCKQAQKPLISAAVTGFQGQLIRLDFRQADQACYECLFANRGEAVENCQEAGVLSASAGVLGSMQATQAIKTLIGIDPTHQSELLMIDTLTWQQRLIQLKQDSQCPICYPQPKKNFNV